MKMKLFLVLLLLFLSASAFAGDWSRVAESTLHFSGHIEAGEVERFAAAYRSGDETLIVNSTGGDAEAGVRLGMLLFSKKMNVIIDGICASSCANYIFTAGATKFIRTGWVGYHGNLTAFLIKDWDKAANEMRETYHLSEQEVNETHQRLIDSACAEKIFLELTGVSQDLFTRTQTPDKGAGDGSIHAFLVPSLGTFARYGIINVKGTQDLQYGTDVYPGLNNLYE